MLAVYPGSFDPPTVAHLAIARAALSHVDEVCFVLSRVALGKEDLTSRTPVEDRRDVLRQATDADPRLSVAVTEARLVVDIAAGAGADAVVVGADKWAQILDPAWYGGSVAARDDSVARLPRVLLAARAGTEVTGHPPTMTDGTGTDATGQPGAVLLEVDPVHLEVSSTRARAGDPALMLPEALAAGHWG
ncbi:adenylyltransferase/cytidyltransferase family protein [Iamia sp.]|uniref:adenylyltransferase/cytidyltransferase family protein n=1 Tax=Iamia sp. TaxID=2722710 RepID=UPI002CAD6C22|nr:adenylyltransferase/cytidyltransferase family protein [Iamia sp.]HXH56308.1 adenylyltransferase/cytidyltransferase family protein [Iamia sp.]